MCPNVRQIIRNAVKELGQHEWLSIQQDSKQLKKAWQRQACSDSLLLSSHSITGQMQIAAIYCGCITWVAASILMNVVQAVDEMMRQVIQQHHNFSTCLHACTAGHAGGAYDKLA